MELSVFVIEQSYMWEKKKFNEEKFKKKWKELTFFDWQLNRKSSPIWIGRKCVLVFSNFPSNPI